MMPTRGRTIDVDGPRPGPADVSYLKTLRGCPRLRLEFLVLVTIIAVVAVITLAVWPRRDDPWYRYFEGRALFREFLKILLVAMVVLAVWTPRMLWRLGRLRRLILEAPIVAGRITRKTFIEMPRDSGPPRKIPVLHFEYQWQGEHLEGSVDCSAWGRRHPELQGLEAGDEVALIVNPEDPSQTFLRDYFWKT